MIIKTIKNIPGSEITDPLVFQQRRTIIKAMAAMMLTGTSMRNSWGDTAKQIWSAVPKSRFSADALTITPADHAKNYNNYYELAFNKEDPSSLAQSLRIDPWSVEIGGEVEKPGTYQLEDILRQQTLQEYIYRFRCVEAWSMVVPWVGFELGDLLKTAKPLSSAKFVKLTSVQQPEAMPKQRNNAMLEWPYVEGLRIDEAMHPLTILAVGMYGDILPKQNGAPLRLVVPWKYGFKSIKAVVKIELLKRPPISSWNKFAPNEYGFYANVNPDVPHPRWSQNSERPLGSGFFTPRRQTELFNGYGEQVAYLYRDMDLRHFF
ncbi:MULTISPECIES: protein-methionine-sulfoxide reductase catalytic subunit MsrP [Methylomonas]|uniref:Protein-methionine-sulfoxide reductase catalytic subunit MsrP n=2 Tax=Methylomonas TaxID=416 RepID=A0A126T8L8_9GAMM|nr:MULTISPECIES: protein-methionine-sulfoxide reductase catalytic subunit MsrP [Methylomonas]AMK78411.1 mononuclear molybdenum enzyme YedY [Methylomonas denitrificans]OAI04116.1 mononuclear molybdenum enzyme YedY [Methylomonas methanica]TCV87559.1 sulfoxide reductase catalytic subunit YedY [Methylomonas methanica]